MARWARSAWRVERVCWRVDFLVWRAVRRGVGGGLGFGVVVAGFVFSEVSVDCEMFEDDCCGAGGGSKPFVIIGDS